MSRKKKEYIGYVKTPEIIREALGEEIYEMFERYTKNHLPKKPAPLLVGKKLYHLLMNEFKKQYEQKEKN